MVGEYLHLHKASGHRNHHVYLLFIPAIIFVLLISFLFSLYRQGRLPFVGQPTSVLGVQSEIP